MLKGFRFCIEDNFDTTNIELM